VVAREKNTIKLFSQPIRVSRGKKTRLFLRPAGKRKKCGRGGGETSRESGSKTLVDKGGLGVTPFKEKNLGDESIRSLYRVGKVEKKQGRRVKLKKKESCGMNVPSRTTELRKTQKEARSGFKLGLIILATGAPGHSGTRRTKSMSKTGEARHVDYTHSQMGRVLEKSLAQGGIRGAKETKNLVMGIL